MRHSSDFKHYASRISEDSLNETQKAVACLWFCDHQTPFAEMTAKELAARLEQGRLAEIDQLPRCSERTRRAD